MDFFKWRKTINENLSVDNSKRLAEKEDVDLGPMDNLNDHHVDSTTSQTQGKMTFDELIEILKIKLGKDNWEDNEFYDYLKTNLFGQPDMSTDALIKNLRIRFHLNDKKIDSDVTVDNSSTISFKNTFKDIILTDEKDIKLMCFGMKPCKSYDQLYYFAGGKNNSAICGFMFQKNPAFKEGKLGSFVFLFHPKLQSRRANNSGSGWVKDSSWEFGFMVPNSIYRKFSREDFIGLTGFDPELFLKSDFFKATAEKFHDIISKELARIKRDPVQHRAIAVKKLAADKANDEYWKNNLATPTECIMSIEEALQKIQNPKYNDKTFSPLPIGSNNPANRKGDNGISTMQKQM